MLKSFFKLMFSSGFRQVWMKRYENYGVVRKILILILLTTLTAGSLVCAVWSIGLYSENVIMGLITSILFIALGVITFRLGTLYSTLGFRMARWGSVTVYGNNKDQEMEDTQAQDIETTEDAVQPKERSKVLDYLIGVIGIIYALGIIVALTLLVYNAIKR